VPHICLMLADVGFHDSSAFCFEFGIYGDCRRQTLTPNPCALIPVPC